LRETFGVIVYQEQVMDAARRLSGYSLATPTCCAARWARRSAPRWTRSARVSLSGAVNEGVEKDQAEAIFELLAKFADYGFNKSHAAPTRSSPTDRYMKANYPSNSSPPR